LKKGEFFEIEEEKHLEESLEWYDAKTMSPSATFSCLRLFIQPQRRAELRFCLSG